jgi:hypothetical protein
MFKTGVCIFSAERGTDFYVALDEMTASCEEPCSLPGTSQSSYMGVYLLYEHHDHRAGKRLESLFISKKQA